MPLEDRGVQPPSAGIASSDEQLAAFAAALVEERRGYEQRLTRARSAGDVGLEGQMVRRLAAVDGRLRALGHAGATKALRADRRRTRIV